MRLPNIWGQGALFAYSGLDGECRVHGCLNGALLGDLLGIRIYGKEVFDLYISLDGIKDIEYEVVASDVIRAWLKDAQGLKSELIFTFLDQKTIVGLCGQGRAQLRSLRALGEVRTEHVHQRHLGLPFLAVGPGELHRVFLLLRRLRAREHGAGGKARCRKNRLP